MRTSLTHGKLYQNSLRDFFNVLFTHKWKIVFFFAVVMGTAFIYVLTIPVSYRSEAKLLVRFGVERVLDPSGTTGLITSVGASRQGSIKDELDILKSQDLAKEVVRIIGVDDILEGSALETVAHTGQGPEEIKHKSAILHLIENLEIESESQSNIILVAYTARKPELAQKVVSTVTDLYKTEHIKTGRPGPYEFFLEKIQEVSKELYQAQDDLNKRKTELGIDSLEQEQDFVQDRISAMNLQLDRAETQLAASEEKVKSLSESLSKIPEFDEVRETRQSSILKGVSGSGVTKGINPAYRQMDMTLINEAAVAASLRAETKLLKQRLATATDDLKKLNESAVEIEKLRRLVANLDVRYVKYLENFEQAKIDKELVEKRITNIKDIQEASDPLKPKERGRLKFLVFGFLLGVFGGVGIAFIADYMDPTLKYPQDIDEKIQLPTLTSVPRMRANRVSLKRKAAKPTSESTGDVGVETLAGIEVPEGVRHYYETLRSRLLLMGNGSSKPPRVIAVTSCDRGEGVSTVAANLATVLADFTDKRVVLVDANLSNPSIHKIFDSPVSPGLTEFLDSGDFTPADTRRTPLENLEVIPAGNLSDLGEINDPKKVAKLIGSLKRYSNFVVFDTPPVGESASLPHLTNLVDGVILVVEAGRMHWEVVNQAKEELLGAKVRVLGVVLNKRRFPIPRVLYNRL